MKTKQELQNAVKSYISGNPESFTQIYELSYKYLHTCVIHIVKDQDIAMDMLQETYIEISQKVKQLQNIEIFLNWAATIANRKCYAYLKKQRDILCDETGEDFYFENIADDSSIIPEELLQDREKQRLLRNIIDELTDIQRLCVIGFYYNEQKQEEIANELGIPVNTVKSHLNRAKAKIKEAVVALDEKKGTRLYSFAPFMVLLFNAEADALSTPPMCAAISTAAGIGASLSGTDATNIGIITTSVTGEGSEGVGTTAVGMTLKAKIALCLAGIVATALIGTGIGLAIHQSSSDEPQDKSTQIKEIDEESEDPYYTFPVNFKSWDTISRNLAGENRSLYVDGHKITMPTTVGEWEELLCTEFVRTEALHSGGASSYQNNMVAVVDKNNTTYIFNIDTESYTPIRENMTAELEQLRNTPVVGLTIDCGNPSNTNSNLAEIISLLPEQSIFEGDPEEINEKLNELYPIYTKNDTVRAELISDGYTIEWSVSPDGERRKLKIKYIPENWLAFYKYLSGDMNLAFDNTHIQLKNAEYNLCDVTNDGIDELIISHPSPYDETSHVFDILAYDWNTGSLNWIGYDLLHTVQLNGSMRNQWSKLYDGTVTQGWNWNAEYVTTQIYIFDEAYNSLQLVELKEYVHDELYYINGKPVTYETYSECKNRYVDAGLSNLFNYSDFINYLTEHHDQYYATIRNFNNEEPLTVYDDSALISVSGNVEPWKENYVSLIYEFLCCNVYLESIGEVVGYNNSLSLADQLSFAVNDINHDGVTELFLALNYNTDGAGKAYLSSMFLPNGSWENCLVGSFISYNNQGNTLIGTDFYFMGEKRNLYSYNGEQVTWISTLCYEETDLLEQFYYFQEASSPKEEISAEEYFVLYETLVANGTIDLTFMPASIENLEAALDIDILQLDGLGYSIQPSDIPSAPVVSIPEEAPSAPAANAQIAYDEFLAGQRTAIVDSAYCTSTDAPLMFTIGEKLDFSDLNSRVIATCYDSQDPYATPVHSIDDLSSVSYGFVACGNYGDQSLVICYEGQYRSDYGDDTVSMCILKYRDGQLYITGNILSRHFSTSSLYTSGIIEWFGTDGSAMFDTCYQVLDINGRIRTLYSNTDNSNISVIDPYSYEIIYYDDILSLNIFNIGGKKYCTVQSESPDTYTTAVAHAQEYLSYCNMQNIPIVDVSVVNDIIAEHKTRYLLPENENYDLVIWHKIY